MNATGAQAGYDPAYQEETTTKTFGGSAIMESLGALATIALAIVGLTGTFSITMAAIATIVMGAAVWIEGGGFAANYRSEVSRAGAGSWTLERSERLGAEFMGGLSGIVLGVLALLGVAPITLLSIAALVFGATFLFSSGTGIGSGSQAMFGLAGLVLGLLAVCGLGSMTLVLVALACLGASALFNGAAMGARATVRRASSGSQAVPSQSAEGH